MKDGTHSPPEQHGQWMLRGAQFHAAGKPELALVAFETALALAPGEVNATSACATLLSELDRPQAAYKTLLSVESSLMGDADGAANLAIAAEACGDLVKAQACYARALALKPDHLRALNNVGILAASSGQWEIATSLARKCLARQPLHAPHHANLCEFLSGARRYPEALEAVAAAMAQFPDSLELRVRYIALLAFNGELEKSDAELERLTPEARSVFGEFLLKLQSPEERHTHRVRTRNIPATPPDALDIFVSQALRDLAACDWRNNTRLSGIIRTALAQTAGTDGYRNWHQAPFHGLMLGLHDDELAQMQRESMAADIARTQALLSPFSVRPKTAAKKDGRIHVGLALDSLKDERQRRALMQQLAHHDPDCFAVHIYAFTPQPDEQHADQLRSVAASLAELGHMSDVEAVARIRLDRLDVYVEVSFESPFQRSLISALRVAAIQVRQSATQGPHMPGWDYIISDRFVHPGPTGSSSTSGGAIVRLPQTSWPAIAASEPASPSAANGAAGLPQNTLLLCALMPPEMLGPQSFSVWMKIMRSLPDALLWLPRCMRGAANLVREAKAAGVGADRLLFSNPVGSDLLLAGLPQTSLCLDTVHTSSVCALEDALKAGVPAITCVGVNSASRVGGSILRAANLPQCVLDSPDAYVAEALRLGRNPAALQDLREQLKAATQSAPLFDVAARVKEWEAAWTVMAERSRAGLPPAAFDVPVFTGGTGH